MVDIHSHMVFDVDDGPSTLNESLRMALEAEKLGFKTILSTSHYRKNSFPDKKLCRNYLKLKSALADCSIEIRLGYEVLIDDICFEGSKEKSDLTLDNTRYMLFELSFDLMPSYLEQEILRLHSDGIIPIIAHPERYHYFIRDMNSFISLIERGCLIQLDAGSILGAYGHDVKIFAKKILKSGLVQFIASDAHCMEDYVNWYPKSYEQVKKWVGADYANKLFYENPKKILVR
jgi:protein-tyrosine phosphatase